MLIITQMYLLMYTVNNLIKMLILDIWYTKFHCNIEIKANRSRKRLIEKSVKNKKQIDLEEKTVEIKGSSIDTMLITNYYNYYL